eukprot:s533_g17.t1
METAGSACSVFFPFLSLNISGETVMALGILQRGSMVLRATAAAKIQLGQVRQGHSFSASQATLQLVLQSKPWPLWLRREMRSNWAGETGAVAIYRGSRWALQQLPEEAELVELRNFVEEHVAAEEAHLEAMESLVCEPGERSWMPATAFGWALGYLSTRIRGAHGMYVTTEAVESFVEEHYGDQIARLELELHRGEHHPLEAYRALLEVLRGACADEVTHKEDAAKRAGNKSGRSGVSGILDSLQFSAVYWASRVGAAIAKHV